VQIKWANTTEYRGEDGTAAPIKRPSRKGDILRNGTFGDLDVSRDFSQLGGP
jgi:hypothetical protein